MMIATYRDYTDDIDDLALMGRVSKSHYMESTDASKIHYCHH